MSKNELPVCSVCERQIFGMHDPCACKIHDNQTLAVSLRHVAASMDRMSAVMKAKGGFGVHETGRLLLQHAREMQGASQMCIDWAEQLETDT